MPNFNGFLELSEELKLGTIVESYYLISFTVLYLMKCEIQFSLCLTFFLDL